MCRARVSSPDAFVDEQIRKDGGGYNESEKKKKNAREKRIV